MPSIHIFNPETDYALAEGKESYTLPEIVRQYRATNALLPAIYAHRGDAILIVDDIKSEDICNLAYFDIAKKRGIEILEKSDLLSNRDKYCQYKAEPWGWNLQIRKLLTDLVGEMADMPTKEDITRLRELSHRRTTIIAHEFMSDTMDSEIESPQEIKDISIALKELQKGTDLYFKAPWSSSGRGVLFTARQTPAQVENWVKGIIRRQGSVMMEKAYQRSLDCATEWLYENGEAKFIGYSVFNVSFRGKYHGNIEGSQQELKSIISRHTNQLTPEMLHRQKDTLQRIIGTDYSGPIGVDMLVTTTGAINPFVEINFRHTMGMLALAKEMTNV